MTIKLADICWKIFYQLHWSTNI